MIKQRVFFLALLFLLCLGCSQEKQGSDSPNASEEERVEIAVHATGVTPGNLSVAIFPREPSKNDPLRGQVQGIKDVEEWRWYRNGDIIPDEVKSVLPGNSAVRGDRITLLVRAGGHEASDSITIGNSPPEVVSVGLKTNQIFRGRDIVTLPEAIDLDGDLVDFRFAWFRNGGEIQGQRSATLPGDAFRKGDTIALQVIPSDGQMDGSPYMSEPFTVPNGPPNFISQPPRQFTGFTYHYQTIAEDPDEDPLSFVLENGPEGMEMDRESGLLSWDLHGTPIGEHEVTISVTDEEGMWARQAFVVRIGP